MIRTYTKEIRAIQWDGTKETLEELKALYPNALRAFITDGTTPATKNSLRISLIQWQGEYWLDVGDYIELGEDRVYMRDKKMFEKNYIIKE